MSLDEIELSKITVAGSVYGIVDRDAMNRGSIAEFVQDIPCFSKSNLLDAVIVFFRSEIADVGIEVYDSTGNKRRLCGSSICAIVKYLFDKGIIRERHVTVDDACGIKEINCRIKQGKLLNVEFELARVKLNTESIPMDCEYYIALSYPLTLDKTVYDITALSLESPYAIVFVEEDVERVDLSRLAPLVENHRCFAEGTSVVFARRVAERELVLRVWLKGVGEVHSCGTAACAAAFASAACGLCSFDTRIKLKFAFGGELEAICDRDMNVILNAEFSKDFSASDF